MTGPGTVDVARRREGSLEPDRRYREGFSDVAPTDDGVGGAVVEAR